MYFKNSSRRKKNPTSLNRNTLLCIDIWTEIWTCFHRMWVFMFVYVHTCVSFLLLLLLFPFFIGHFFFRDSNLKQNRCRTKTKVQLERKWLEQFFMWTTQLENYLHDTITEQWPKWNQIWHDKCRIVWALWNWWLCPRLHLISL